MNANLDQAIIEATCLFIAGISRLYQSRLRSLRELQLIENQSDRNQQDEESVLVENLLHQYQENVRVASACIEDLKTAARNFFAFLPEESTLKGEKAWSFFCAYCRNADRGRTPKPERCGAYAILRSL